MISKKHQTIFVHIPKVAGQSLETVFLENLGLNWETRGELLLRKKMPQEAGPSRLAHLKASDYVALGYIDKASFQKYFKFSFVRNPYTRAISLYKYLGYGRIISFSNFVHEVLPKKIENQHFFFIPQYDYLYGASHTLLVDFVGKLENIDADSQFVFNKLGLENAVLPHVNKSEKGLKRGLAHLVKTPSLLKRLEGKRLFRNLPPEIQLADQKKLQELYDKDFKYFNYEI